MLSRIVDKVMNLSILGLTDKEERVYLSILHLGEATATEIAKNAKLKRTSAYNIIPSLLERGFIQTTQKRGIKYFFVEDVKSILQNEEEKMNKIKSLIPKLQALHNVIPHKPLITLHEGLEGFKYIYNDFLANTKAGDFVRAYAGTKDLFKLVPKDFLIEYMEKRIKSKIPVRLITNQTDFGAEIGSTSENSLRDVRYLTTSELDFHGETLIYNGKVAFISYKENYLGVIIESQQIYQMHKGVFDELWGRL